MNLLFNKIPQYKISKNIKKSEIQWAKQAFNVETVKREGTALSKIYVKFCPKNIHNLRNSVCNLIENFVELSQFRCWSCMSIIEVLFKYIS